MTHVWTPQQIEIFDWFATGTRNLLVEARAGSAKTTTLVEGIRRCPKNKQILFTAFNKHSAEDIARRLGGSYSNCTVKTLHGVGYQILREKIGYIKVNARRSSDLIQKVMNGRGKLTWELSKLLDRVKDAAPWAKTVDEVIACGTRLDAMLDEKKMPFDAQAEIILSAMQETLKLGSQDISFSDMVFIPYRMKWGTLDKFDLVCIDELQDINPGQLEIALNAVAPTGRVIGVGDDAQVIYQFRGATENVFEIVREHLDADTKHLTVCFRCSKAVVAEARRLVSDIQVPRSAPDGSVDRIDEPDMVNEISSILSDAKNPLSIYVLSRFNAPLFPLALQFLERRVPCAIQGQDYANKIAEVVESLKPSNRVDLDIKLGIWAGKRAKLIKGDPDDAEYKRASADLEDMTRAIQIVADHCGNDMSKVPGMIRLLFEPRGTTTSSVLLSTIHRIKGYEADVVFILEGTIISRAKGGLAKKIKNDEIERNIEYVAITRAKHELWWVQGVLED